MHASSENLQPELGLAKRIRLRLLPEAPETPTAGSAPEHVAEAAAAESALSARERRILRAVAEAAVPAGRFLEGAGPRTLAAVERYVAGLPKGVARALKGAIWAVELEAVATHRRPFSSLPIDVRAAALRGWEESRHHLVRSTLRAVLTPVKYLHFYDPKMFEHVGCRFEAEAVRDERPRWLERVTDGREVEGDLTLECEVVVVGTGAGGAAAAYELARRGRAVLLLEEGDYHRRAALRGRSLDAYRALYRDQGLTMAFGNVGIPVWAGRAVGGSTVVNSGTCYRTPERTLRSWRERFGLPAELSETGMAPYFERVERMLGVALADPLHVGSIAGIIARGAEHLGYAHHVLRRNAPDCDGQGVCCFGCPTAAKRSTDVSYVPEALKHGAELVTAARVDFVDIVAGRARGVTATLAGPDGFGKRGGRRPKLTVKADAVVVAGGTMMTPLLLRRSRACLSSGWLGKNLSIHPATKVMALFDERVEQWRGIPQGYSIDHFADEGLMFEGSSLPLDVAALGVPWTGARYMEIMEQYPHLATFGFMIQDESRGEVREGPGGSPLLFYNMNARDLALMQRGLAVLSEVFLRAGARRVFPFVAAHDEVTSPDDLARLRSAALRPGDFEVTAFHPLGTCRVGADPKTSCLDPEHEAHDVARLFVCDGSAVPSSLGVNPQITIMAMALRAAEAIDARLG
jgi:choline dehydrogenase-like flavoprotein